MRCTHKYGAPDENPMHHITSRLLGPSARVCREKGMALRTATSLQLLSIID